MERSQAPPTFRLIRFAAVNVRNHVGALRAETFKGCLRAACHPGVRITKSMKPSDMYPRERETLQVGRVKREQLCRAAVKDPNQKAILKDKKYVFLGFSALN